MSGLKNHIDRSVTRYVVVAGFRIDLSLANMMLENILKTEWFEMLRYFIILREYFSKSSQRRNLIPLCLQEIIIDLIKMILIMIKSGKF